MLQPGDTLGDCEIVAPLKHGGMATLYLGRRGGAAGFARPVAIKVVHPHLAHDPRFVEMFLAEALLCARIDHPNVVHVEELREHDGTYFLVMEFVRGHTLGQLMIGLDGASRPLEPRVAVAIAVAIADGLHAAHETRGDDGELLGVVHRDVSPQNVLLSAAGHVKLIDFGIARVASRARTATGTLQGKLQYMPPEQAYGRPIDRRADVYALGVVLWELLAMRHLFDAENELALLERVRNPTVVPPSRFHRDVPAALDVVVMQALAVQPDDRPPTARALRTRLVEALPAAAAVDANTLSILLGEILGEPPSPDRVGSTPRSLDDAAGRTDDRTMPDALVPAHEPRADAGADAPLPTASVEPPRTRTWPRVVALLVLGAAVTVTATWLAAPRTRPDRPAAVPTRPTVDPPPLRQPEVVAPVVVAAGPPVEPPAIHATVRTRPHHRARAAHAIHLVHGLPVSSNPF